MRFAGIASAALFFITWIGIVPSIADPVADFYHGKNVELYIGGDVGGGYDNIGRLVARYISKYIPGNPSIVVKNNGAAAGISNINFLYNEAARDGTIIGITNNSLPLETRLKITDPQGRNLKFDIRKFNWIGSPSREAQIIYISKNAKAKSLDDLQTTEATVAALAAGGDTFSVPLLLDRLVGTKLKIIAGYGTVGQMNLAIEDGEVDGSTGGLTNLLVAKPTWLKDGIVRALVQFNVDRHPLLQNTPTILDLVKSNEDRQMMEVYVSRYKIARPFLMPPNVPQDRLAAIRAAFDATMEDKSFLDEARTLNLDIAPTNAPAMEKAMQQIETIPEPMIHRLRALLQR
jgi:tripartite-type tricarboxylate transporter receptor subunit TctC